MNANEFSDALGEIDSSYVSEAITYRKRGRWIPWAAIAACLVLVFHLIAQPNAEDTLSPPVPTGGIQVYYADGVPLCLPQLGDSALTINSVRIDLDIPSLERNGSNGLGTAVIEITMHNPTDEPLTVPVALPCGQPPHYLNTYDQNYNIIRIYPVQSLYHFTWNGTTLWPELQITATEAAPDTERMQATKRIRLDATVTKYTYRITELEESENPRIALWGFSRYSDYIVLAETGELYTLLHSDQEITIPIHEGDIPQAGDAITVYVIGDHPEFKPGWFFKDWNTKERLDGATALESTETMTFLDFASQSWKERFGISKENWAFSVAAELDPFPVLNSQIVDFSVLSAWTHHWLTYDLTLLPGVTNTHRIELPLYPGYLGTGSRTYRFDLRTLQALNPTGSQTMTLETPFHMDQTSAQWNHQGNLYGTNLSNITDTSMTFTLSNSAPSEEPQETPPAARNDWITILCVAVLIGLFFLHRKYRKERL